MKSFETLLVDIDGGGVATVTLNRPEAMNAFNLEMTAEFDEAIWSLERDESVRVIVLTGAGKAFSTGIDLAAGGDTFGAAAHEEHNAEVGASDSQITDRYSFWTMRTPMIAAINGIAIGAGLTLTFLADIRVVADDARLAAAVRPPQRDPRRELDVAASPTGRAVPRPRALDDRALVHRAGSCRHRTRVTCGARRRRARSRARDRP